MRESGLEASIRSVLFQALSVLSLLSRHTARSLLLHDVYRTLFKALISRSLVYYCVKFWVSGVRFGE